jgi:hypothetical protein
MKTQRIAIVVLSLLVLVLGYFAFRKNPTETPPPTTAEAVRTNTLEMWHTNSLERWRTNTEFFTNTVVQTVTNEVIKEVPARLSGDEKQAGILGYKTLHAPILENASDALYKLGPVGTEVFVDSGTASALGVTADDLKKKIDTALKTQNVELAENSPHTLRVNLSPLWKMSDPRVALVRCRLDLKDVAVLQRQNDIIKLDGIVWSTTSSKFVRTVNMAEGVGSCLQDSIDRFCSDYREARERQKDIESRLPKVSPDFLTGALGAQ